MVRLPESRDSIPASTLSRVVFPVPLPPTMPMRSCGEISQSSSENSCLGPKCLPAWVNWIIVKKVPIRSNYGCVLTSYERLEDCIFKLQTSIRTFSLSGRWPRLAYSSLTYTRENQRRNAHEQSKEPNGSWRGTGRPSGWHNGARRCPRHHQEGRQQGLDRQES